MINRACFPLFVRVCRLTNMFLPRRMRISNSSAIFVSSILSIDPQVPSSVATASNARMCHNNTLQCVMWRATTFRTPEQLVVCFTVHGALLPTCHAMYNSTVVSHRGAWRKWIARIARSQPVCSSLFFLPSSRGQEIHQFSVQPSLRPPQGSTDLARFVVLCKHKVCQKLQMI